MCQKFCNSKYFYYFCSINKKNDFRKHAKTDKKRK